MSTCMLTTTDNPYDYFKHPQEWEAYDRFTGNRVSTFLGRFAMTSPSLSNEEYSKEIERAIDEIVKNDMTNTFKKVIKD